MKELIKPNSKEVLYSEIEGYCERGDGYYYDSCGYETNGDYSCYYRKTTEDYDGSDILF